MADITLAATTVSDGSALAPALINASVYDPDSPATSLAEINGLIEKANFATGAKPQSAHIRDRSMGNGRMVGSTANMDILAIVSPDVNTDPDAYAAIPGCGIAFYLPLSPRMLWITFQVITAVDTGDAIPGGSQNELKAFVDGAHVSAQFRSSPYSYLSKGGTVKRLPMRDRVWSGHIAYPTASPLAAGWHTFYVGHWASTYEKGATRDVSGGFTRFRVRNAKFFWLA